MEISSWGNTYLQDASPWTIFKTEPESPQIAKSMFVSLQVVGLLGVLTKPFLPWTSDKIQRLLQLPEVQDGDLKEVLERLSAGEALLETGGKISEPELLFAKINDRKDTSRLDLINEQKAKIEAILAAENAHEPLKDEIEYDDFAKLDIRTGTILAAEKVENADKLLKLKVDLGFEERTVVSGIAKFYEPEKIIGKQVLVLANLKPRKLRGIESQGMILMAENEKGELAFVAPNQEWGNGFTVS